MRSILTAGAFASALLAACDWPPSTVCPPEPAPNASFTGLVHGCGDFFVARQSSDSLRILHVQSVLYPTHRRDTSYVDTLDSASTIRVAVLSYGRPQNLYSQVCDDVGGDDDPVAIDSLRSGIIEVRAWGLPRPNVFTGYGLNVLLRDVVLKSGTIIDSVRFDSVSVGWLAG
jgi:hypothetical protein